MQIKKNEEVFSSKIVKFASYEEYTGKHIYPIVMKTSSISILILILYVVGEYFFRDKTINFMNYFISYLIGANLILMMVYSAYKKNIKQIIVSGNIAVIVLCSANIFVDLRMTNIIHIILLFMFGAIIVAPLLTTKLFLIPNLITNIFILLFLVVNEIKFNEISKFLLFSMTSTFFMIFILKYLRESAVNLYLITRENFYYSNLDMLSKLLNRRAWYSLSMKYCKENFSQDMAFMMIDIDYFKKVNDTYGHDCGDLVIQEVAKLILENSPTKSIVGRLGGEEFGVLLQSVTIEEAVKLSENLRQIVENKEMNYEDKKIKVTLSIGLVVRKETELDSIVKLGDEYLYKAKNSGRNRVMSNIS